MVSDDQYKVEDEHNEEQRSFVPHYVAVPCYRDKDGQVNGEYDRVAGQREPVQLDVIYGRQTSYCCNSKGIKEHRSEDCAQTHVRVSDERANQICKKLRGGGRNCHESSGCYVL